MYRDGRRVLEVQRKQKDEGTITKEGRIRSRACSRKEERAPFANYPRRRRRYLTRDRWEAKRERERKKEGKKREKGKKREREKERNCVCVRGCFTPLVLHGSLGESGKRDCQGGMGDGGLVVHETALTPPRLRTPDPLQRWPTSCWRSDCRIARGTFEPWIPPYTQQWFSKSDVQVRTIVSIRR